MSNLPSLFSTEFPNADSFFSNEDNYCLDIVLLSTLLRGVRHCESRLAPAKIQKTLEWWSSLASLLSTDTSGAMSAPTRVAVTGRIEADAIKALVFTQSNPIPDLLGPSESIVIKKPDLLVNVEGLLNDSQPAESLDSVTHVQNFGSVIDHVLKGVDPMPDLDSKLFKFVICGHANEAWTKIDDGIRIWHKHPITILEEWYSDEKNSVQLPRKIINPNPKHVSTFRDFGILPDAEGPSYILSSETALKWVKLLSSCLNHLVTHLSSPPASDCTLARKRGTILEPHDINQVNMAMSTLKVVLHYKVFQHLISPHSLLIIFHASSLTRRTVASVEDPVEELAYEASAWRDNGPTTSISKHVTRYVTRYLRSMIFPRRVVDSLLQFQKGLPPGFKSDMVVVEARPAAFPNANDYYQHFKDKYIQVHGPKAESYIKKHESPQLFNSETWTTDIQVHPEAALMGVACASDSKSKEAQTLMEDGNIPIGVVRRCCFCCALLAEFLGTTGTRRFTITGSFATISPWMPPYGVPDHVLRKVRDALFYILNQKVQGAGD